MIEHGLLYIQIIDVSNIPFLLYREYGELVMC